MHIPDYRPLTPGEILQTEFIEPLQLTQGDLAEQVGMSRQRTNEIIKGTREVTADSAIRLGKLFGMSPQFWLLLQLRFNLWQALHATAATEYEQIKPIHQK